MVEDPDDPFEGLVLDEAFVRAATTYEPPARTRAAIARHTTTESPRSWSPEPAQRKARRRNWLIALVIAAVVVGIVLIVQHTRGGSTVQGFNTPPLARPTTADTDTSGLVDQNYQRGHCYTWDQASASPVAVDLPCAQTHLFEAVGPAQLTGLDTTDYPTQGQWQTLGATACSTVVEGYLHHAIDPTGRLYATAIHPVPVGWFDGERTVICGVAQRPAKAFGAATATSTLDAVGGRADALHQAMTYPVGTCMRFDSGSSGSVPCDTSPSDEVVGAATLPSSAYPSQAELTKLLTPLCRPQASSYVGRAFTNSASEYLGWDDLSAASWQAGTRTVNCYLSFAKGTSNTEVTGSHRSA